MRVVQQIAFVSSNPELILLGSILIPRGSKQFPAPVLISVNGLLISVKANDAISEELAELLGFEELELAMDILHDRSQVAHEVCSKVTFTFALSNIWPALETPSAHRISGRYTTEREPYER